MSTLNREELINRFPFLKSTDFITKDSVNFHLIARSEFYKKSLIERKGPDETDGISMSLYVVINDALEKVEVHREKEIVYPAAYFHPYNDYPADEEGRSESIAEALVRTNMEEAQCIVLDQIMYSITRQLRDVFICEV